MSVTTRRAALRGASIVGLLGIPAIAVANQSSQTNPDAELIALCDRTIVLLEERASLCKADPWAPDRGPLHARYEATWAEESDATERLYDLPPPTTLEGARAMARATLAHAPKDLEGRWEARNLPDWLALSVAEFLAGSAVA